VSNDEPGLAKLKSFLGEDPRLISLEASGRYESLARHELEAAGYLVKVLNPRKARRLAEGLGINAKTDRVDAKALARMGELSSTTKPRSKERELLGDVSRSIDTLKKDRAAHLKRMKVPGFSKEAINSLKRVVKAIDREIENLGKEFVRLVRESSAGEKYKLLQTIPGVGPELARICVCELPEDIENWSSKQVCAYAGVAPIDDSSGKRNGPARVPQHANFHLKAGLFMPALGLMQRDPWASDTYARLKARGLEHQQAAIVLMHKLLVRIVAVLKRGTAWQAACPTNA
jgi:transposase